MAFSTTRHILTAVRWSHTVSQIITDGEDWVYPDKGEIMFKDETLVGDATMTRTTRGLKNRVGEDTKACKPLVDRQVRAFDDFFNRSYLSCTDPSQKRYWARAGLANQFLWLGWLRATELFDLRWMDVEVTRPAQGPTEGLPPGVGCIKLKLSEQTKTSRSTRVDVPIAYTTTSGYQAGKWYERLLQHKLGGADTVDDPTSIFANDTGATWTSSYYRQTFVYPLLYKLKLEGDPLLSGTTNVPGSTIPDQYPSLHMYRRGAKTHVEVKRAHSLQKRKATPLEVYEHGRWRVRRSSESAPTMYREWTLWDRLQVTFYCT